MYRLRYDLEEKILEKSIRTEIMMTEYMERMEKALEKMAAYTEACEDAKKTLEETKVAVQRETTERLADMEQNLTEFKSRVIVPTISFNVRKAKILTPAQYQVMTFEHVIQNNGTAYDDMTGIFTAPYDGTYLFAVQVCAKQQKYGDFILVVDDRNNEILVVVDYEKENHYTSTSGTVIHWLAKGQKVWVMNNYQTELYEQDHWCSNQFSGVLIHT